MTKSLSVKKIVLSTILVAVVCLFSVVLFGCGAISKLTNTYSSDTQSFSVGQTKEQALASITVTYYNATDESETTFTYEQMMAANENDEDDWYFTISGFDTSEATEEDEEKTCSISVRGVTTSFKYTVG